MGHYDCDECGEFGCVCRKSVYRDIVEITYHTVDRTYQQKYKDCTMFVSRVLIKGVSFPKYRGYYRNYDHLLDKMIASDPDEEFKKIL